MVSTSGSSGIPSLDFQPLDFQRLAGHSGGHLLRVFFGPSLPRTEAVTSNVHRGQVPTGMIGAETLQLVVGNTPSQAHCLLLEPALVVGLAGLTHSHRNSVS